MQLMLIFVLAGAMASGLHAQTVNIEKVRALAETRNLARPNSSELELKLQTVNQAITESPQDPELQLKKGVYLLELGRIQSSIDVFEALRASYPAHPAPYINLAAAYAQQGNLEEARQMLVKSDALHGGRYQTHLSLAAVNIGLALSAIRKANELKSGDPATERKIREIEQLLVKVNGTPYSSAEMATMPSHIVERRAPLMEPVQSRSSKGRLQSSEPSTPDAKKDRLKLSATALTEFRESTDAATRSVDKEDSVSKGSARGEAKAEILNIVESWASAWSGRNHAEYISYYSKSFNGANGLTRDAWANYKKSVIDKASYIRVDVKVQQIQVSDNAAKVVVLQRYKSDIHSDVVRKELKLILENANWRIASERIL